MSSFVAVYVYLLYPAHHHVVQQAGGGQNNRNTSHYGSKYCFGKGVNVVFLIRPPEHP